MKMREINIKNQMTAITIPQHQSNHNQFQDESTTAESSKTN